MALFAAAAGCIGVTATLRNLQETLAPRALGDIAGKLIDVEKDRRHAVHALPLCVYVQLRLRMFDSDCVCLTQTAYVRLRLRMFLCLHAYLRTWILANQQNHHKN